MNEVWLVILPLIAGYLLDLVFGDPRTIPHPVVGFGNMISWAERHFNCGRFRKWKGAIVALSLPLFVGMAGWGITVGTLAVGDWCFCIVASVFVFYGLANHSLIQEGKEVIDTLKKQGVEAGRRRLSWIVGRDTSELSPKEIYTAVLETMENMKLKLGYRKIFLNGQEYRGHEFHYSRIIPGQSPLPSIARVTNAKGMEVDTPVYRSGHVTASYIHFYWGDLPPFFI